jgi:hypothetical protein
MKICRNLTLSDNISSIEEWFNKCPPQRGILQWRDGRSAKETAKHWINGIPKPFTDLFKGFELEFKVCSPEYVSDFDNLKGNGRNHDLLIIANDPAKNQVVISVESKVDESFGNTIGDYMDDIQKKNENNIPTKANKRILALKDAIIPNVLNQEINKLRYQLLTAVAGTLSEAKKQNAKSAFFIVQTFFTETIDQVKHKINQTDLDYFVDTISNGKFKSVIDGALIGPMRAQGNEFIPNNIDLWIGKYSL